MTKITEGQRVPNVTFRTRRGHEWIDRTTEEIFSGKSVIVFSLPGAFTPTCSSAHVPRYDQLADTFKGLGIDDIVCISVNDGFVMSEWQESQKAWNLTFLPDGNGEFTDKMGMLVDKEDLGFGKRSWRYSMLVRDGVVEKVFSESEVPGDPYSVSDADTMLHYLSPAATEPPSIALFSRKGCPHCARARDALDNAGLAYEELKLNEQFSDATLRAISTTHTYPRVFIDGRLIGGADELENWLKQAQAAA